MTYSLGRLVDRSIPFRITNLSMSFEIDICNKHDSQVIDLPKIRTAVEHTLTAEQVRSAVVSVTIVDNPTMHRLNREHLQHDYPTDVISFQLEWQHDDLTSPSDSETGRADGASIEGEVIVSLDFAESSAATLNWSVQNEITLYVVHGLLHICGYDDLSPGEKEIMRAREKAILGGLGLSTVYPADEASAGGGM